eukprot:RCo029211
MMADLKVAVCIVGAGPAGLGAALAFHQTGHTDVHVFDSREVLETDPEETYPIGLNVRGQHCLLQLCGEDFITASQVRAMGLPVQRWKICVGKLNVANVYSGKVLGMTRMDVVQTLLRCVQDRHAATLHYAHKAVGVDPKAKTVTFTTDSGKPFTVEADRLIIADGYRSKLRDDLAREHPSELSVSQWTWNNWFRVMWTAPNPTTELDPGIHYIFSGGLYVAKLPSGRWTISTCHREGSAETEFMLSDEPTRENVAKLKAYISKLARVVLPMLEEEEFVRYFSRRIFTGAVTRVTGLGVANSWAILMGDAAHSVYPATGEG